MGNQQTRKFSITRISARTDSKENNSERILAPRIPELLLFEAGERVTQGHGWQPRFGRDAIASVAEQRCQPSETGNPELPLER
jgi:hypothetical protein